MRRARACLSLRLALVPHRGLVGNRPVDKSLLNVRVGLQQIKIIAPMDDPDGRDQPLGSASAPGIVSPVHQIEHDQPQRPSAVE